MYYLEITVVEAGTIDSPANFDTEVDAIIECKRIGSEGYYCGNGTTELYNGAMSQVIEPKTYFPPRMIREIIIRYR